MADKLHQLAVGKLGEIWSIMDKDGGDASKANLRTIIAGSSYQDLGLAIEGLNMAAGAYVYVTLPNLQWVRNIIIFAQSDQQYDVGYYKQDSSGIIGGSGQTVLVTQVAYSTGWKDHATITGANAILGYGAKFFIKNSAAVANTFARIRIQLLGE